MPKSPAQSRTCGSSAAGTSNKSAELGVPAARGECPTAACAPHWSHRSRAPCRRSAARAGSCRRCRRQAGPRAPPRARPRRGRAARRSWWRKNRDRAAARCAPRSWARGRPAAAPRRRSAVRRSCQTMALWIGRPVARSQMTVVSRWLVMPSAAISLASRAGARHRRAHGRERRRPDFLRIVLDQAGRRIDLAQIPAARSRPARARASNTMARVEVVPWSIARR